MNNFSNEIKKEEANYEKWRGVIERDLKIDIAGLRIAGMPRNYTKQLLEEYPRLNQGKKFLEDEEGNMFQVKENLDKRKEIKLKFLELAYGKDKKWSEATELLVEYIKDTTQIYTTKSDNKSEMWVYNEGVYEPDGRSEIKRILRDLLDNCYSVFIYNKVVEKLEPDTYIKPDDFFKQEYKEEIPVQNGILNVRTLELSPFRPDKIFFNKLPVTFDITAQCPMIIKFLKEVLRDENDINVFFEMVGFCLYKEYTFEKAFMLVGNGRNGKSKAIELIKRMIGVSNTCSIQLTSLIPESFSISELFGKMVNLAGDISNTDLKETGTFKTLTGRDIVGGKRKFLNDLTFENYAKFIFACNELPMVYDMSRGFWDRWVLLEFPYTFVTQDEYDQTDDKELLKIRDDEIINKISTPQELSGLLNMALVSLNKLFKAKKFSSSLGTDEIKSTWIKKSNSFIAFCYDKVEGCYDGSISKKELRKEFAKYCKDNNIHAKSDYVIKRILQDNYGSSEERQNTFGDRWEWFWVGIKWKEAKNE